MNEEKRRRRSRSGVGLWPALAVLVAGLAAAPPTFGDETAGFMNEAWLAFGGRTYQERDEALRNAELLLQGVEERATPQSRIRVSRGAQLAWRGRTIGELQSDAAARLAEMRQAGPGDWRERKIAFLEAYGHYYQAMRLARGQAPVMRRAPETGRSAGQ